MSLNKQRGNMYGFVTHTWNTIKGKCFHDCGYCYMKRRPLNDTRFDKKELSTNLGKGNFIFVGSSNDMFNRTIPREWILKTLEHARKFDNQYLFQSKNPRRFQEFISYFPEETTLCTTIESNRDYLDTNAPLIIERLHYIKRMGEERFRTMITIEPIMDFDSEPFIKMILDSDVGQINIGADSGNNNLPEPGPEKLNHLLTYLNIHAGGRFEIHQKKNLLRLSSGGDK